MGVLSAVACANLSAIPLKNRAKRILERHCGRSWEARLLERARADVGLCDLGGGRFAESLGYPP